jgi:26S proteasome regulatory subunit N12
VNISFAFNLERRMMEGSYHKILSSRSTMPNSQYSSVFLSILEATIRDNIAQCTEKAYLTFPVAETGKLLFLDSQSEQLKSLISRRGWIDDGKGNYVFDNASSNIKKDIKSHNIIQQTLEYSKELEKIV